MSHLLGNSLKDNPHSFHGYPLLPWLPSVTMVTTYHSYRFYLDNSYKYPPRWDILLKIQAPLLILPESFHNTNSAVVIMDLGQVGEPQIVAKQRRGLQGNAGSC